MREVAVFEVLLIGSELWMCIGWRCAQELGRVTGGLGCLHAYYSYMLSEPERASFCRLKEI
jgi:hypothetical protein